VGLTNAGERRYSVTVTRNRAAQRSGRSKARIAGAVAFGLVVAALTAVFSAQIIVQAWTVDPAESEQHCHQGLKDLLAALERARQSAARQAGEFLALAAFRNELGDSWRRASTLRLVCATDPPAADLLERIDALRYAEEQAVRNEARELAKQRRGVQQLARTVLDLY
jgi:hypothetical protein